MLFSLEFVNPRTIDELDFREVCENIALIINGRLHERGVMKPAKLRATFEPRATISGPGVKLTIQVFKFQDGRDGEAVGHSFECSITSRMVQGKRHWIAEDAVNASGRIEATNITTSTARVGYVSVAMSMVLGQSAVQNLC